MTSSKPNSTSEAPAQRGRKKKADIERYQLNRAGELIDWQPIERDFRAGILSIRAIAAGSNIADATLRRKAKLAGWQRNLKSRVLAAVQEKVQLDIAKENTNDVTAKTGNNHVINTFPTHPLRARNESSIAASTINNTDSHNGIEEQALLEVSAQSIVNMLRSHRHDIRAGRETVSGLLDELSQDSYIGVRELLAQAWEHAAGSPEQIQKMRQAVDCAINLPKRAAAVRDLLCALKVVIGLERQALQIDSGDLTLNNHAKPDTPIVPVLVFEEMMAKIRH